MPNLVMDNNTGKPDLSRATQISERVYQGDGWTYDKNSDALTLKSGKYDFNYTFPGFSDSKHYDDCDHLNCVNVNHIVVQPDATIVGGNFWEQSLSNYGTVTNGLFKGTSVTNHGTLNCLFPPNSDNSKPTGIGTIECHSLTAADNSTVEVLLYSSTFGNTTTTYSEGTFYFTGTPTLEVKLSSNEEITCINGEKLYGGLTKPDWKGYQTFTPKAGEDVVLNREPYATDLVITEGGFPDTEGREPIYQDNDPTKQVVGWNGKGWKYEIDSHTLTLESGRYDFSGEENALGPLNPNVQLVVESGATLTGGAAGDGSGVTWQLTENTDDPSTYKLTISGSGAMEDFPFGSDQPWYSFHDQITSVVVSPGVTSIGQCAFSRFAKLTHVDIADSVISIGWDAFYYCSSLTNITIPQSVTYIGPLAFFHCTNLSSITLSNNITSIGSSAFEDCTNLTSITIPGSVTSIGLTAFCNCTKLTSITIPDSVTTIDLEAFKNCSSLTSITIPGSVTSIGPYVFDGCTSLNDIRYSGTSESVISALSGYVPTLVTFDYGDKVPEAERMIKVFVKTGGTLTAPTTIPPVAGYEFKGWLTEDGELYDFPGAPTGQLTLYAKWEKIPEPKPEPTPDPEPETPTYTLTVKGGTFTYNGGEAMTSASVPVDAEVKVTLNQSAVPEGMVFDLWAMDEASLLGNPAVAYNQESFTIPAGSVAKGSTVTVEAQYRDATIESEPSILGTAAIIGVAGAGTAVIVWQGYRIGMELYEKYFQPTPEETVVVEPTLEGQMTDPIS